MAASGEEWNTDVDRNQRFVSIHFESVFYSFFCCGAVSLLCSGSVTLTRGHTVPQRDSTPSLVHYTPLWWGFIALMKFFIQIQYLIIKTHAYVSFLSFSLEAHVQSSSFIQRTQNRWYNICKGGSVIRFSLYVAILTFCFLLSLKLELITTQAMKAGFSGGMVVDYPNSSKAKKSVPVRNRAFIVMHSAAAICNRFLLNILWNGWQCCCSTRQIRPRWHSHWLKRHISPVMNHYTHLHVWFVPRFFLCLFAGASGVLPKVRDGLKLQWILVVFTFHFTLWWP